MSFLAGLAAGLRDGRDARLRGEEGRAGAKGRAIGASVGMPEVGAPIFYRPPPGEGDGRGGRAGGRTIDPGRSDGDPRNDGTFATGSSVSRQGSKLLDAIDRTEGGGRYDTLFGHSQRDGGAFAGVDVSRMTLGELDRFQSTSGEYGRWVKEQLRQGGHRPRIATPAGRYQIVGTTRRNVARALGLAPDTVFDSRTQDRMALHLIEQRLSGAKSLTGKRRALRAEWEGFQHVSDAELDAAIREFERSS